MRASLSARRFAPRCSSPGLDANARFAPLVVRGALLRLDKVEEDAVGPRWVRTAANLDAQGVVLAPGVPGLVEGRGGAAQSVGAGEGGEPPGLLGGWGVQSLRGMQRGGRLLFVAKWLE